jgi:hypothetical protein
MEVSPPKEHLPVQVGQSRIPQCSTIKELAVVFFSLISWVKIK